VVAVVLLVLVDGGRRVAGTCPTRSAQPATRSAGAPGGLAAFVAARTGDGRFYDDGADRRDIAVRRTLEAGGFDELRPEAGVAAGIRYAGENDVDRMMPVAAVSWARATAALAWGAEKVARLRAAGVSIVRTPDPGPDPAGVVPLARSGADRVVRLAVTRPTYLLIEEARFVSSSSGFPPDWDPLRTTLVESPGGASFRRSPSGPVRVVERRPARDVLEIDGSPGAALVVARTHDPFWRATVDGKPVPLLVADGTFTAILLPPDARRVVLEYRNPLLPLGALLSLATLAVGFRLLRPIAEASTVCEDPRARATTTDR
jgi:hypothetical protein